MRSRPLMLVAVVAALSTLSMSARAQARADDPMAVGLTAGDYIRVGGGITAPVGAQGSLKSFKSGGGAMAYWENWQNGGTGVGRVGFGLGVGYSMLPFDAEQFVSESGGTVRSATGDKAGILEIISNLRLAPHPVIPAITFGFGYINWMRARFIRSTRRRAKPPT